MRATLPNAAVWLAGTILAIALIWFLGPLVPGLDGAAVRFVLCGVALLAWAGATLWSYIRRTRRESALEQGLLGSSNDLADEAAGLRERFADALKTLKGARLLHGQPWYVIIGPPGAGKTTALLNAGLSFPLAEGASGAHLAGVGGTRSCDWWFTDRAVLIDTAGRYTTQDSDAGVDRAGWYAFLDLLQRTRPRQPLNGIIVAIAAQEIAGAPPPIRTAHAQAIRARVEELGARLKKDLPVYMMFTKTDLVAGFTEFFDDLDVERRGQVWGTTFALGRRRPWPAPDTEQALNALVTRLDERVVPRLQAERSPERRRLIAGFPAQIASLAGPLAAFVAETFGGSKLRPAPLLRGVYLTSGTQEGTPVDRLTGVLARAFGVSPARLPSLRPERGRSYFLHRLLAEVLPGEAMLVSSQPAVVRRRLLLRGGGFAAVTLATLAACAVTWQLRASGLDQQRQVQTSLAAQAAEAARHSLDPVADTDLPALLPLLDHAREMPFEADTRPPGDGLNQAGALGQIGRTTYRAALQHDLLPRLMRRLEGQIAGALDRPEFCYEATRVYLMLGGAGPLDPGLVGEWMRLDWQSTYGGPGLEGVRDRLSQHLDALLAVPLPAVALDGALVEQARSVFGRVSPAARVYGRIRRAAPAAAVPAWRPRDAMGPLGAVLFARTSGHPLDEGVPGFLTPAGFYGAYLPALAPAIRAVAAESWVVGAKTGVADDSAKMAALETEVNGLYQADFQRAWDGLLDDLQLVPLTSVSQAAQDLYVVTSPQSPIRTLLTGIVQQVTLPAPGGLISAVSGAFGRAGSVPPPASAIAAHYQPLIDLVGSGPGAPIDQALRSLTDVQQLLAKMAAAAINAPAPAAGTTDPIAALRTNAQRWPNPLRRWLTTIADSSAALRSK